MKKNLKRLNIKKKNKNKFSIENYPKVVVSWLDIESNSAWQNFEEFEKSELPICKTMGHLYSQSKGITRIFGDYTTLNNGDIGDIGNTTIIPNSVIVKIEKI